MCMKDSLLMGTCEETGRRGSWGTRGEWMRIWGVGMKGARGCAGRKLAGLVRHESMMHRRVEGRVRFACEDWGGEATKGALVGHRRMCGAARAGRRLEDGRRECGGCGARVSNANFPVTCGLAWLGGGGRSSGGG